jgi:hypothetical protein
VVAEALLDLQGLAVAALCLLVVAAKGPLTWAIALWFVPLCTLWMAGSRGLSADPGDDLAGGGSSVRGSNGGSSVVAHASPLALKTVVAQRSWRFQVTHCIPSLLILT